MNSTEFVTNALELESILRRFQMEAPELTRARERNSFDDIAGPCRRRLVLFGAGPLGKTVLTGLRQTGVEPLAFADNRIASTNPEVMGLPVLTATEAAERYGDNACFVVTIYQGSSVRSQLASLGCRRIAHFGPLFWKYADVFIPHYGIELPHKLLGELEDIRSCYEALSDEASKRELCEQLTWRFWLDFSVLSPATDGRDTYFPLDLIAPIDDEVFVDCGSFQGDSLPSFVEHWKGRFRQIFALEPDPVSRAALQKNVKNLGVYDRVTPMPYALGKQSGTVSFASTGTVTSQVVKRAADEVMAVECKRLDEIAWPVPPTYIKMDIEGAEPEAIEGASELLRQHQPVLAACTYHRSEHLWQIPNLIRSLAPEYNLFLRRYAEECWEGVCYAIPTRRLKRL